MMLVACLRKPVIEYIRFKPITNEVYETGHFQETNLGLNFLFNHCEINHPDSGFLYIANREEDFFSVLISLLIKS